MAERRTRGASTGAHVAPLAGGWGVLGGAKEALAHLLQRLGSRSYLEESVPDLDQIDLFSPVLHM